MTSRNSHPYMPSSKYVERNVNLRLALEHLMLRLP
jgi:hypothetical protein